MNSQESLLCTLLFCIVFAAHAQPTGSLTGRIVSEKNVPLAGITITLSGTSHGSTTDSLGAFAIRKIEPGTYVLIASSVGFSTEKKDVVVRSNEVTVLDLALNEQTMTLREVTILAARDAYFQSGSTSGTRLPLRLVETPQTIQIIPNQVLKDQQAQNLNDVTRNMTGVINNAQYSSYTMRGFLNSYNNQFITFDGFIGNMYWWNQMVQLYNIDRVEMIAGPASALYSTGSPGGVINMVTKRPLEHAMQSFNLTMGSWNQADFSADLGGPLSKSKKWLYRFNFGVNRQNSFRPSQFNTNIVIAPSITYRFNDRTDITIDYINAYNDTRYVEDHGGKLLMKKDSTYDWKNVDIRFLFNSPKDYGHINNNTATLRFNHRFNDDFRITYMSRAIWSDLTQAEHYGDYYGDNYLTTLPDSMHRAYDTWTYRSYNFQNSIFATANVGKGRLRQTFVGGVDYQVYGDWKNRYINGPASSVPFTAPDYSQDNFNYAIDSNTYVWDVRSYNRQAGVYLQDLISIGSKVKILAAGRYEDFLFTLRPNSSDTQVTQDTSTAKVFLPRFGAVYSFNNKVSAYASYCESFTPQYDNMRSSGGPFPPQRGKQYEVGYKGLFYDGKLFTSVALYSIDFVNIVTRDPNDPSGVHQIVVPGLKSRGAEFTVQGNLKQWSIIAGYAYNHVEFSENSPLGPKGGRYDNAPNHVGNLWVKYTVPENSPLKGLSISVGGKYVGDRVGWATNQHFHMPPFSVFDAGITYARNRYTLTLNGYNLINARYVLGYYASDLMVQVGTPASWKAGIRYTISR